MQVVAPIPCKPGGIVPPGYRLGDTLMSHNPRLCPICAEELLGLPTIQGMCADCWRDIVVDDAGPEKWDRKVKREEEEKE